MGEIADSPREQASEQPVPEAVEAPPQPSDPIGTTPQAPPAPEAGTPLGTADDAPAGDADADAADVPDGTPVDPVTRDAAQVEPVVGEEPAEDASIHDVEATAADGADRTPAEPVTEDAAPAESVAEDAVPAEPVAEDAVPAEPVAEDAAPVEAVEQAPAPAEAPVAAPVDPVEPIYGDAQDPAEDPVAATDPAVAPSAEAAPDPVDGPGGSSGPGSTAEQVPAPAGADPAAAEARRLAVEQAAADLAEVKRWAAERAAADRAAAEATALAAAAQAAADEAEVERAAAEQAAADLAAVREWAAQRAAAEQDAARRAEQIAAEQAEQVAAERRAAEQAAADQLAAERAAVERAEAERAAAAAAMAAEREAAQQAAAAAAEQAAAQQAAAQQAAAQQAAAQTAAQQAAAQAAAQQEVTGRPAVDRAAAERADVERAQAVWAEQRQAAADKAARRPTPGPRTGTRGPAHRGATAAPPPAAAAGRRRGPKVLLAALLALVLVAAGVVLALRLTGGDPGTVAEDAEQVPDAVLPELADPGPVLDELSAAAPVPTPAALSAVLDPLLAAPSLGTGLSAQVVDVATGQVLFDRDAADPSTPASTAKLLTGLAALTTLGPTATLSTTVVQGGAPGEVVLVGGGDPTLSTTAPSVDYPGAPTVADLAAQVRQALGAQQVTGVVVDSSLFTGPLTATGWGPEDAPSTYAAPVTATAVDGARVRPGQDDRSGAPGTDAGRALAAALGAPDAAVTLGAAPAGAQTLGSVESVPVARLVDQALTASDNLLSEALGRQVALARGLPASFDGAADAITAAVTEAGLDTAGLALSDASGLSQLDRVPAQLLVAVVRGAADGSLDGAGGLLSGLPVAGYTGTLTERAVEAGQAGPGSVRAKTGTLLGVNDLAGTVVTADGRLLAFAVLADGTVGSLTAGESSLDLVADALAGCGCR